MIYQVTASNRDGIDGVVHLSSGKEVETSHPLNDLTGFNPEELMGLAWSTCLNATIQALMERELKPTPKSRVDVQVTLVSEGLGQGYAFELLARAAIQGLSIQQAQEYVQAAHKRCPVSKLIQASPTVTVETVGWSDLNEKG